MSAQWLDTRLICAYKRRYRSAEETQAELFEKFKVREAACGQHVVSCPACAIQFQKISGCNHITCVNPSCRKEFCYLCGGDYYDSEGNYHFDGRSICTSSMTMVRHAVLDFRAVY